MESVEYAEVILNGKTRKRLRNDTKKVNEKKKRYIAKKLPEIIKCSHTGNSFKCNNITKREIWKFFKQFYNQKDKIRQDSFLLSYCLPQPTKRHDRNNGGSRKNISINYFMRKESGKCIRVCRKLFLSTLHVSKDRIQRLCKRHLETGEAPIENRGGDRKLQKNERRKQDIINFIKTYKVIEIHYCRNKTAKRQYLPNELSINKMWRHYNNQRSDLQVKNSYFRNIFNRNFNIGFKMPCTDVCSVCLNFKEQIKIINSKDDKRKLNLMTQYNVHKRGNAFFKLLGAEKKNTLTMSFDCQKNMVLPKVPDQSSYYSRQLYLYLFGIVVGSSHDKLTRNNVFLYSWAENDFAKGSNEISSALYYQICNTDFENKQVLRLFCDGCGGQNKNTTLLSMIAFWLCRKAPKTIKSVEVIFPVPGHSFIPPDRVFALIEKKVRAKETIIQKEEYYEIYSEHGNIIQLGSSTCPVLDWKSECARVIKPPGTWHFKFNPTKRFILTRNSTFGFRIRGETFYKSDLCSEKSILKKGMKISSMQPVLLPRGVSIKPEKIKDVDKLLTKHFGDWRERPELSYYREVINSDPVDLNGSNTETEEMCQSCLEEDLDLRI